VREKALCKLRKEKIANYTKVGRAQFLSANGSQLLFRRQEAEHRTAHCVTPQRQALSWPTQNHPGSLTCLGFPGPRGPEQHSPSRSPTRCAQDHPKPRRGVPRRGLGDPLMHSVSAAVFRSAAQSQVRGWCPPAPPTPARCRDSLGLAALSVGV
jgi:hypothetical protein